MSAASYRIRHTVHTLQLTEPTDVTGYTSGLRVARVQAVQITVHDNRDGTGRVLATGPTRRKDGSLSAGAFVDVRVNIPGITRHDSYPEAPEWLATIVREVLV